MEQEFEYNIAGSKKLNALTSKLSELPGEETFNAPWGFLHGTYRERDLPAIAREVEAWIKGESDQRRARRVAEHEARRGIPTSEDFEDLSEEGLTLLQALLADGPASRAYRLGILQQITRVFASGLNPTGWWTGWKDIPEGREDEVVATATRLVHELLSNGSPRSEMR
jgi:hypothetical protein